jgi:REP element-mobilizing transposase RayT
MPASIFHRRSIRLKGFDYAQPGSYFITICTWHKCLIFGEIIQGEVVLSNLGEIARKEIERLPHRFSAIAIDGFVVMPNHIHILITISEDGMANIQGSTEAFKQPVPGSIPTIVRSYKAAVTQRISAMRDTPVSEVWHHNYYEHFVRNENEREKIFLYLIANPAQWDSDEENPAGKSKGYEHG